jgi:hypothetical protein
MIAGHWRPQMEWNDRLRAVSPTKSLNPTGPIGMVQFDIGAIALAFSVACIDVFPRTM